jgi:hypothetical protein
MPQAWRQQERGRVERRTGTEQIRYRCPNPARPNGRTSLRQARRKSRASGEESRLGASAALLNYTVDNPFLKIATRMGKNLIGTSPHGSLWLSHSNRIRPPPIHRDSGYELWPRRYSISLARWSSPAAAAIVTRFVPRISFKTPAWCRWSKTLLDAAQAGVSA